jgi:hypothetical protein
VCSSYNITSILKAFLIIKYQNLNSRDGAQIYPYKICGNSKRKGISQFYCAQVVAPLLLPLSPSVSLSLWRSYLKTQSSQIAQQYGLNTFVAVLRISEIGYGAGAADPCLLLMNPAPDPAIFVTNLHDANKKQSFSAYYLLKVHLHHFQR